MDKKPALVFLLIFFFQYALSQTTFIKTYSFNDWEWAWDVKQTDDNGYILVGFTEDDVTDNNDIFLIKTDSLGDTIWTKTYGGQFTDEGRSVIQTLDGGYIVSGVLAESMFLMKTNSMGDSVWSNSYGGANSSEGNEMQKAGDGGYVLAGSLDSNGNTDFYVVKTDSSGNEIWGKTFGDSNRNDIAYSIQQTAEGGFIVGGKSILGSDVDPYLIKIDSLGNELWSKSYVCPDNSCIIESVNLTSDNGYIVAIHSGDFLGAERIHLVKTDTNGDTIWTKTYGMYSFPNSVAETPDGGYIIGGTSGDFGGNGSFNLLLIKVNAWGDTIWTGTYGSPNNDFGYAVQPTNDGGYALVGALWFGTYKDIVLVKIDSLGNAPPFVSISKLAQDQNSIFIYPNPTTGHTTVTDLPQEATRITIYNALGALIYAEELNGPNALEINLSAFPIGLYYLQVFVKGKTLNSKVIKL